MIIDTGQSPSYGTGLAGWFDGFCPSNGIADDLNRKRAGVVKQTEEWQAKYDALENGTQASEWADLKQEVARLEEIVKEEKRKLGQEKGVADALGLGAWCNGAVSKRKKAETALRDAENALGQIKGAYETLENQQTEGIKEANRVIVDYKKVIETIQKETEVVKQKIAKYKAQREADKIAQQSQANVDANAPKKLNMAGFASKENLPMLLGGVLLLGTVVYFNKKNKELKAVKKTRVKKVTA